MMSHHHSDETFWSEHINISYNKSDHLSVRAMSNEHIYMLAMGIFVFSVEIFYFALVQQSVLRALVRVRDLYASQKSHEQVVFGPNRRLIHSMMSFFLYDNIINRFLWFFDIARHSRIYIAFKIMKGFFISLSFSLFFSVTHS